jgi:hypothetical protein
VPRSNLGRRLVAATLLFAAMGAMPPGSAVAQDDAQRAASQAAFKRIVQVMRHPRCMNCHTPTDFPKQGEDSHRHEQMVLRGLDNQGDATLRCFACHQSDNMADGRVPGAPGWRLAPRHMGWEPSMTDSTLCDMVKNKETNGNRDSARLVEHLIGDDLVQWAFAPGTRSPPPITQTLFHESVKLWAQTGMGCPATPAR